MTKAEKIFKDTRWACRKHIKAWGAGEKNPNGLIAGFNRLVTEEVTSTRTFNAVQKEIDKAVTDENLMKKYGVVSDEEHEFEMNVLEMVQATLNNSIESERKFNERINRTANDTMKEVRR